MGGRGREREQEIRKRADSHWRGSVLPCLIAASSAFLPLDHVQCRRNEENYGISVLAIVILLFFFFFLSMLMLTVSHE